MSIFVKLPWHDNRYVGLRIPDLDWYLHPPYVGLFLKFSDQIDLSILTEPTACISANAYKNIVLSESGRIQFYERLMSMIEVDQLTQIEERMRIHPQVQCHSDPENYLKTLLIKVRWYDKLIWTEEDIKSVKWYYHPPFLYLTLFHHDDIDLSTWLEVPFYVIEYILDQSYEGLSNTTSREMRHFYTALLKLLKLYELYNYNPTSRSPSSLQSNEQLVSTVVYRNDGKINPKKRSQEDSASYTDLHDKSSNSSRKTTIRNEPTRYENPTSENNISCSRNTQPNLRLFSDSAFGDYVELSTHGNHIIIIDNACSHHLTKPSSNVRNLADKLHYILKVSLQ